MLGRMTPRSTSTRHPIAVLDGDIDDIAEHVALERAARRRQ
jgi:hypothetical protein